MRQTFHIYQKMRKKIPHLLILMSSLGAVGEIWFCMKNRPKKGNYVGWNCVGLGKIKLVPLILRMKMTGVIRLTHWEIFKMLHPRIWAPPTHFQKWWKISKSNSQGIRPKVWYPRNQRNSLNQLQVFEIEKSPTQKSYADFLSRNSTYIWFI